MRIPRSLQLLTWLAIGLTAAQAAELQVPGQFSTIQAAINAANSGDTVIVSVGTYRENIVLKSGVTVQGCGAADCVIQGDGTTSTVMGNQLSPAATIDGFAITGGAGFPVPWSANRIMGGGIFADASTINIGHNRIITNQAQIGGGIALMNSRFNIIDNTISSNLATTANPGSVNIGGGIYLLDSTGAVSGNQILDNTASSGASNPTLVEDGTNLAPGGGIAVIFSTQVGDVEILSNRIAGNTTGGSQNYGGGIYLFQAAGELANRVYILANTIADNSGLDGGGIASVRMSPIVVGNNISGNSGQLGGGLFGFSGNGIIAHNTIEANSAVEIRQGQNTGGGGILCDAGFNPLIAHNTIRTNTAKDYGGGVDFVFNGRVAVLWKNLLDNNSARFGGGVAVSTAAPTIVGNYFRQNSTSSESGGGLFVEWTPSISVVNNIFASNRAARFGGGMALTNVAQASMENNTLNGNTANWWGGGLYVFGGGVGFHNNIVSNNGTYGVGVDGGASLNRSYDDYFGNIQQDCFGCLPGTGEMFVSPSFADATSFRLQPTSALVDSGNPDTAFNDPDGSRNDIGAYGGRLASDIPLSAGGVGAQPSYDPVTRVATLPNTDLGVGGNRVSLVMKLTPCAADPSVAALKLQSFSAASAVEDAWGVFFQNPYLVVPRVSVGGRDYDVVLSLYSCASDPGGIYGKLEALAVSL